jgi:hypothetical protein
MGVCQPWRKLALLENGEFEVFSSQPRAFAEDHMAAFGRMTRAVLSAANRGSPFVDNRWPASERPALLVAREAVNLTAGQESCWRG